MNKTLHKVLDALGLHSHKATAATRTVKRTTRKTAARKTTKKSSAARKTVSRRKRK